MIFTGQVKKRTAGRKFGDQSHGQAFAICTDTVTGHLLFFCSSFFRFLWQKRGLIWFNMSSPPHELFEVLKPDEKVVLYPYQSCLGQECFQSSVRLSHLLAYPDRIFNCYFFLFLGMTPLSLSGAASEPVFLNGSNP